MPRVAYLSYRLRAVPNVSYERAPSVAWSDNIATYRLDRDELRVDFRADFSSFEEAQATVEPMLKSWETKAALERGDGEFRFIGNGGVMEPTAEESKSMAGAYSNVLLASATLFATASVVDDIFRAEYPAPPTTFAHSPLVQELTERWNQTRQNREPVLSAANYILTKIEEEFGGGNRDAASRALHLDKRILRTVGDLAANRGDALTARKFSKRLTPLSPAEQAWLSTALPAIVARIADNRNPSTLPELSMGALPKL